MNPEPPRMRYVEIENITHPLQASLVVGYCSSFMCRLRGLMFRKKLGTGEGLLLVGARDTLVDASIHMMFMNFDLAVVWINQQGEVVDTVLARRWRLMYLPKRPAQHVLEISAGHLQDFSIGDKVRFHEVSLDR